MYIVYIPKDNTIKVRHDCVFEERLIKKDNLDDIIDLQEL